MSKDAAIFPGQGAQTVGMGRDVAEAFDVAARTFEQADQVLGFEISKLCFEGPEDKLNATDIQQPAIFVTSVAIFRAATKAGLVRPEQFAAAGGLSLGEYTALHIAGAIDFEPALRLVHRRGQLMQQACQQHAGAMVSILGGDEARVRSLCEKAAEGAVLGPANFNCPGQIVISGDAAACQRAVELAGEFDLRAIPLKVAGAFHSDLMRDAAEQLRETLAQTDIRKPQIPVVANTDGGYHGTPEQIRDALYRQVFSPVRWQGCVERMAADGCTTFWEFGPGRVLTGLMRKIDRKLKAINVSRLSDIRDKCQV